MVFILKETLNISSMEYSEHCRRNAIFACFAKSIASAIDFGVPPALNFDITAGYADPSHPFAAELCLSVRSLKMFFEITPDLRSFL
jgi:hypothetical protein